MSRVRQALSKAQPFPGLRPFDYGDQDFFFGRRHQISSLFGLLDRSRFVAVIGSSGSGKSSLTRAGLLPVLEQDNRESRLDKWTWCAMRPGDAPLTSLADALADSRDPSGAASEVRRHHIGYQLNRSSFGLADAIAEAGIGAQDKFVLVVDQFEELFRYSVRAGETAQDRLRDATLRNEARRFVELLLEGRRSKERDIRVLITMRSDFIGECADFPGLPEAVSGTQFLVPGLERDEIEQIILDPVVIAGAEIKPDLVQDLLTDAEGEPDQLPVLQHCLLRLWQQAGEVQAAREAKGATAKGAASADDAVGPAGRCLDKDCYVAVGKLSGAITVHAEAILRDLSEPSVEAVFRALSELKDGRSIRRALPYAQLRDESGVSDEELRKIVDRFRADDCSFLVTWPSGVAELEDDTVIDVGHEALLRRWERNSGVPGASGDSGDTRPIGWLRKERKDGQRYQSLLSMLDSDNPSRRVEDIERHWAWWHEHPRTKSWANRYGGKHKAVEQLLRDGWAHRRNVRVRDWALAIAGAVIVASAVYFGYSQSLETKIKGHVADANFERSLSITRSFLSQLQQALNSGGLQVDAAMRIEQSLHSVITDLKDIGDSSRTAEIELRFDSMAVDFLTEAGQRTAALKRAEEAQTLAQTLSNANAGNDTQRILLLNSTLRLADALGDTGDQAAALERYRAAQSMAKLLADKDPDDGSRQYALAFSYNKIGEALSYQGDYSGAREQYRAALSIATRLAARSPDNAGWQAYVPNTMTKIAEALARSGSDVKPAVAQFDAAMAIQNALAEKFKRDPVILSNLAASHRGKARALVVVKRWDEASSEFVAAIAVRRQLLDIDPKNSSWLDYLATDHSNFADALVEHASETVFSTASVDAGASAAIALAKEKLLRAAFDEVQQELVVRQELSGIDPNHVRWKAKLAETSTRLGEIEELVRKSGQAG